MAVERQQSRPPAMPWESTGWNTMDGGDKASEISGIYTDVYYNDQMGAWVVLWMSRAGAEGREGYVQGRKVDKMHDDGP
jgi:hypothetical protein